MATVIHLVRHGEVHNPTDLRYGQLPGFHLSRRGEAQARAAGAYIRALRRPIAAIVSSPLERAVQTATLVGDALGVPEIATDPRLLEASSRLDGLPRTIWLRPWRWSALWGRVELPESEPDCVVAERLRAAVDEQAGVHSGEGVILVSHQSPIWLARHALESRRPPWFARVRCAHASVTSLEFGRAGYVGHTYWAPHVR